MPRRDQYSVVTLFHAYATATFVAIACGGLAGSVLWATGGEPWNDSLAELPAASAVAQPDYHQTHTQNTPYTDQAPAIQRGNNPTPVAAASTSNGLDTFFDRPLPVSPGAAPVPSTPSQLVQNQTSPPEKPESTNDTGTTTATSVQAPNTVSQLQRRGLAPVLRQTHVDGNTSQDGDTQSLLTLQTPSSPTLDEPLPEPEAPSATSSNEILFYSWQDTGEPVIRTAVFLTQHEAPGQVLLRAQAAWDNLPPEERCLMIAPWAIYQDPPYHNVPLLDLVESGPDMTQAAAWWTKTIWALQQNNFAPYRVALDWETGMSYWHLKGEGAADQSGEFVPLWANPQAFAKLPEDVRSLQPADMHWQRNRQAIITWNRYATEHRNAALQRTYLPPLREAFPDAKMTNYGDTSSFQGTLKDRNGWPLYRVGMTAESSPMLYRKNSEDNLALIRGIIEGGGPMPVPWVSYPSYIGRDAWEATIRGAHQLGVREFLYWNPNVPDKADDDDAFAAALIAELNQLSDAQAHASYD